MVNASNFNDIPATVWKLPRPQLSNCLSMEQREVLKTCIEEQMAKNSKMTAGEDKSSEESSKLAQHKLSHYGPSMMVSECILLKSGVRDGKTEDINMKSLISGFITMSSLSVQQKDKAEKELESCFQLDWTLPTPPPDHHMMNKTIPEGAMQRMQNDNKAVLCAMKALIKNGCGEATKPSAALTMSQSMKIQLAAMEESEPNSTTMNDGMDPESIITTGDGVTAKAARMIMLQTGWR